MKYDNHKRSVITPLIGGFIKVMGLFLCGVMSVQADVFKVEQWQTEKGAKVVFYQTFDVPMLNVNVAFAAGSAYDGKHFGLSTLTTSLLDQGNSGFKASLIAKKFANVGAQFYRENTRDMVVLGLKTMITPDLLAPAIKTFGLVLGKPDFPDQAFLREQKEQLLAITQRFESPEYIANMVMYEKMYRNHPYAHPVLGTSSCVESIHREDIIQFHRRYFVASNAIIILVGAIQVDEAHRIAEEILRYLPKGRPADLIPSIEKFKFDQKISVPFQSNQTILRLGQIGINYQSPNYFPLLVGNYILGGGNLVSRLSTEIREKRGLTYGIGSQLTPLSGEGPFFIGFATENKQADQALKITQDTLKRFIEQGPDELELKEAKQYLLGSFPLSFSDNMSIARILLQMTFYHLPENYVATYREKINAIKAIDIKKAFQREFLADNMLLVSVGNHSKTQEKLKVEKD